MPITDEERQLYAQKPLSMVIDTLEINSINLGFQYFVINKFDEFSGLDDDGNAILYEPIAATLNRNSVTSTGATSMSVSFDAVYYGPVIKEKIREIPIEQFFSDRFNFIYRRYSYDGTESTLLETVNLFIEEAGIITDGDTVTISATDQYDVNEDDSDLITVDEYEGIANQ